MLVALSLVVIQASDVVKLSAFLTLGIPLALIGLAVHRYRSQSPYTNNEAFMATGGGGLRRRPSTVQLMTGLCTCCQTHDIHSLLPYQGRFNFSHVEHTGSTPEVPSYAIEPSTPQRFRHVYTEPSSAIDADDLAADAAILPISVQSDIDIERELRAARLRHQKLLEQHQQRLLAGGGTASGSAHHLYLTAPASTGGAGDTVTSNRSVDDSVLDLAMEDDADGYSSIESTITSDAARLSKNSRSHHPHPRP